MAAVWRSTCGVTCLAARDGQLRLAVAAWLPTMRQMAPRVRRSSVPRLGKSGPSIGPLSDEEYQQGIENMRKLEEEQRENRRFLGLESDPNEPGPHIEAPETPEITPGPGTF